MHRKTTSRRENKRLAEKHRRNAAKQALRGDHLVEAPSWSNGVWRRDELPLDMEPRPMRRKGRKKQIEYCPARESEGKKRHYYIEKSEVRTYTIWWPEEHDRSYERHYKVCMYCGKTVSSRKRWRYF